MNRGCLKVIYMTTLPNAWCLFLSHIFTSSAPLKFTTYINTWFSNTVYAITDLREMCSCVLELYWAQSWSLVLLCVYGFHESMVMEDKEWSATRAFERLKMLQNVCLFFCLLKCAFFHQRQRNPMRFKVLTAVQVMASLCRTKSVITKNHFLDIVEICIDSETVHQWRLHMTWYLQNILKA